LAAAVAWVHCSAATTKNNFCFKKGAICAFFYCE